MLWQRSSRRDSNNCWNPGRTCKVITCLNIIAIIKKVEAVKWESLRPPSRSEERHFEMMNNLEKDRFGLVKSIDDLELTVQRLEAAIKIGESNSELLKDSLMSIDRPSMNHDQ